MLLSSILYVSLPLLARALSQIPLTSSEERSRASYQFQWPIRRVAIIGAGVGGLITYRELSDAGFDVHIYERDYSPGGNWHYTDEIPVDAPIPNADISVGDYTPTLPPSGAKLPYVEEYFDERQAADIRRAHRAPKPVWASLKSNAPAPVQQIREFPWPKGTEWELPHQKLRKYLRAFASWHGINNNDENPHVSYNTRVELVEPRLDEDGKREGWTLTLKHITKTDRNSTRATWTTEAFDAVIVATGRYNAPNIPNIDGLEEWGKRFHDHVSHSRQYRFPHKFTNKTVLIVGAATSGGEISREINSYARKIYQSIRPDNATIPHFALDAFLRRIPQNVSVVPEIKRFKAAGSDIRDGRVELVNGTVLTGIDHVIFATGFRYTYPFLPQYHNSSIGLNDTVPHGETQPIITDGTHIRSLYLDTFYIDDPTLAFINVNIGMQSFTYAEFLSLAIAKVWAGKTELPATPELWKRHNHVVKERGGYGRHFQFLGAERTRDILRFFQGWLNSAAVIHGGKQINGLSEETAEIQKVWTTARFGSSGVLIGTAFNDAAAHFGCGEQNVILQDVMHDAIYNDSW